MDRNPILDVDGYKLPMFKMLPEGVTNVYSYAESRGGRYPSTVFFGLQPYLMSLIERRVTLHDVEEAASFSSEYGVTFNYDGWGRLVRKHQGSLPVKIRAVPEGTLVPTKNVLCSVENTDEEFPWLTTYLETSLLRAVWYGTTVATRVFNMKRGLKKEFEETADNLSNLPFALLDFSSRGSTSYGSNEIGGAAYLTCFRGSDSIPAVRFVNAYYFSSMSGNSVDATEHFVMTTWGREREKESFKEIILRCGGPGKIVSIVCDSFSIYHAVELLCEMADWIRSTGTILVIRPDSGGMQEVLSRIIPQVGSGFGSTTNSKRFEVLNQVKILWGDGIDQNNYLEPFEIAKHLTHRVSADSIMDGCGNGIAQKNLDRDTCKFAFKASAVKQNGVWRGISKDPITDPGKRSKEGRLSLILQNGVLRTASDINDTSKDVLRTVYKDGVPQYFDDIETIRGRIDTALA